MKKYVVAYMSLCENELLQTIVESTSKRSALLQYLATNQDIVFDEEDLLNMEHYEQVVEQAFNMDSYISAFEIE